MQLRTPGLGHAVHGPDPAVLLEVRRRLGMPVLRVEDRRPSVPGLLDQVVDLVHHSLPAGHRQASRRIGEVVLDVDDEKRDATPEPRRAHLNPPVTQVTRRPGTPSGLHTLVSLALDDVKSISGTAPY